MGSNLSLLSFGAAAASTITFSVSAQSLNLFEIYPDASGSSTTFASRGDLSNSAGELLQAIPASHFAHVGDFAVGGGGASANGFRLFTQDERSSTRETFSLLFRREMTGGGIDTTDAGILFHSGPFMTPPARPGAVIEAWEILITFASPITLPSTDTYYMGVSLSAAPGWATLVDGQSVHAAAYPPSGRAGDFPRAGAPAYSFNVLGGNATPTTVGRCWNVGFLTAAPVLNMGGRAPGNTRQAAPPDNFGGGGMHPDAAGLTAGRFDDLVARTRDSAFAHGFSVLYLSAGRGPGAGIPGIQGTFGLNPAVIFKVGIAPLDGNGVGALVIPLGPGPSTLRTGLVGLTLNFQAIDIDASLGRFQITNVSDVSF